MPKEIICKRCGENVGPYWSSLSDHLWAKHRDLMLAELQKQGRLQSPTDSQKPEVNKK